MVQASELLLKISGEYYPHWIAIALVKTFLFSLEKTFARSLPP
ncbi:hypothetical protein [Nostoc sp.]